MKHVTILHHDHTVYRYNYRRALSLFCDELLQSLERNEAAVLRYKIERGMPIDESVADFITKGANNAVGPLTPSRERSAPAPNPAPDPKRTTKQP